MPRPQARLITIVLATAIVLESVSCGTLIYPERCGQPKTGRLDTSIVLLDGLGVLVFVIPGVVAFVVDFATGAIYLPERYGAASSAPSGYPQQLTRIQTDPAKLNKQQIEMVVRQRTGKTVDIDGPDVVVKRVDSVDAASPALLEVQQSAGRYWCGAVATWCATARASAIAVRLLCSLNLTRLARTNRLRRKYELPAAARAASSPGTGLSVLSDRRVAERVS